jgi:kynurenine 3-monooxygenase
LPNAEGSFTVTLFLPNHAPAGAPSFANLDSPQAVREFFARDFADAVPLMPDYEKDFAANPTGLLGTLYLDRWHIGGRALLVGDAAHAIVPFHGQGMNCGFEDAVELAELMDHATAMLPASSPSSSAGASRTPTRLRRWRWRTTSRCATASPTRTSC